MNFLFLARAADLAEARMCIRSAGRSSPLTIHSFATMTVDESRLLEQYMCSGARMQTGINIGLRAFFMHVMQLQGVVTG
ncbi:hypothetical protein B0J12DRAFT_648257 [Macrophomina phaseolina]|uniref:Uncharacterized protein n=1 Tax=Macrophomina phaseolina TaxID=35725 RepID=A0ABQ8GPN2_9PEZI|nr:hypothetical protein B0J12DRAFT_648257 [Macrophomina phaseolina]